ncbi:hypothetical protein PsorP6_006506 [Peronosclerospora sorghi]|uniref:Uncharacterized protein n=1 Tax=Peronosclerospora sorghi TaxID=230839 RepID=A0ACC0W3W1_9STRA|nr:hypothetical protein PsorP6_006506 [Peronosclerospora sorghi]
MLKKAMKVSRTDCTKASSDPSPLVASQGRILGTCESFCPLKEEIERTESEDLSRFERPTAHARDLVAVKKYRRAAAGRDVLDASELRPAPVLLRTLHHLFTTVLSWPHSGFPTREGAKANEFVAVYHFVSDRVRSVRQDFIVQRIEDVSLVTALEQIVRFYLLAGFRSIQLLDDRKTDGDWSDHLNDQQLISALARLQVLYEMHEVDNTHALKNADEFLAYHILLHAHEPHQVLWILLKLSSKLRYMSKVQRAVRTFVAYQTDNFHIFFTEMNTMTFFEQISVLRHVSKIWIRSLHMMNKSVGKQDRFPLEDLARWMNITADAGPDLAEQLCQAVNIQTQRQATPSSIGYATFKLTPLNDKIDPQPIKRLLCNMASQIETKYLPHDVSRSTTKWIIRDIPSP